MDASGLDGLATAFFAVYQDDGEFHGATGFFDDVDCFQCGTAGSDDVIHDDDVLAGGEVAFDLFSGTVAFWLFADCEDLEGFFRVGAGGGHADGERNRIRAECHATDGLDGEFFRMDLRADGVPAELSDECRAEGIHGGDAAVDVEIGLFSGGQGEGAGADGFFQEEGF